MNIPRLAAIAAATIGSVTLLAMPVSAVDSGASDRYAQFGSVIAVANANTEVPPGTAPSAADLQAAITVADLGIVGNRLVDVAITDDSGCVVVAYQDGTPWALFVSENVQGWTPAASCAVAAAAESNPAVWTKITNGGIFAIAESVPADLLTPAGSKYLNSRYAAFAKSDVKTLATQAETYFTEWQKYPSRIYPSKSDPSMIVFPNGDLSPVTPGAKVRYVVNQKRGLYCIAVTVNGYVAVYANDRGGLMSEGTPASYCSKYKPRKA